MPRRELTAPHRRLARIRSNATLHRKTDPAGMSNQSFREKKDLNRRPRGPPSFLRGKNFSAR